MFKSIGQITKLHVGADSARSAVQKRRTRSDRSPLLTRGEEGPAGASAVIPDLLSPLQRRERGAAAGPDQVKAAAAQGLSGAARALPHREAIQRSFGSHDIGGVQSAVGGAAATACQEIGAEAYASGNRVAFRSSPDLHTAAHEAAHVIQQRAGVQLDDGIGRVGDAYELQADRVADRVVRGESAESLLGQVAPSSGDRVVQRFEANEHKLMGDKGSGGRKLYLSGLEVTFGDITAMAGDYFKDVSQIKGLAEIKGKGPGTCEEVEYVLTVKIRGHKHLEKTFGDKTRRAVMKRYYQLAGNNPTHFTNPDAGDNRLAHAKRGAKRGRRGEPVNNAGSYRKNHRKAIALAVECGQKGWAMDDDALLYEGFASHFLTDAYAAGHVRTERAGISTYWNKRVPNFWSKFLDYMAATLLGMKVADASLGGAPRMSQRLLREKIVTILKEKGITGFTFGDVVSGALHDYDNAKGVQADVGGQTVRLAGDGKVLKGGQLQAGGKKTLKLAADAVKVSLDDLKDAYGQARKASKESTKQLTGRIIQGLLVDGCFPAEAYWPKALPDARQGAAQKKPRWQHKTWQALLADPQMQEGLRIFMAEKAGAMKPDLPWYAQAIGPIFEAFLLRLKTSPARALAEVIQR